MLGGKKSSFAEGSQTSNPQTWLHIGITWETFKPSKAQDTPETNDITICGVRPGTGGFGRSLDEANMQTSLGTTDPDPKAKPASQTLVLSALLGHKLICALAGKSLLEASSTP